jgi:hypothetical protein
MSENRPTSDAPKRKAPKTAFVKGQSGNPGGRPKLPEEVRHVRELARAYTTQAVEALVAVLASKNDSARVAAANALIDRGWGKSEQPLVGADGGAIKTESKVQVSGLTDEQLRALASIPVQSD